MDKSVSLLLSYLQTGVTFMVVLTILVAVHELGHFLFARWFGMKVESFAVMMGGIRKTKLDQYLETPLVPAWQLALLFLVSSIVTFVSAANGIASTYTAGLFLLAIVGPLWTASRYQALYHLRPNAAYYLLAKTWIAGLLLLYFATKGQNITITTVLGILCYASFIGMIILYYNPLLLRDEEASEMGHGEIKVKGEKIPVRYRPVICTHDKKGTEYSLLALPLGGFARIAGMEMKEDGSEAHVEGGFFSKSPFARFWVLFAGPLFSIVFGILCLTGGVMLTGIPSEKAIIGEIMPGTPAATAGLKSGDRVLSIDGKPVKEWQDMLRNVQPNAGKALPFVLDRNGTRIELTITPKRSDQMVFPLKADGTFSEKKEYVGQVGAAPSIEIPSFSTALGNAAVAPLGLVQGLVSIVRNPSIAKDNLGGVGTTVSVVHEVQKDNSKGILTLAGLLSVSLGVMNLLPIFPLDGGQILVTLVEMVRRKRATIQVQRSLSTVGMMLVAALFATMILFDIMRFTGPK
jgi:regulator of sigma E protease